MLTVILLPVAPVLHWIVPPAEGVALNVVDPPLHNKLPALLLIVGAAGEDAVVTDI